MSFISIPFVICIYILVTGHKGNRWSTITIRIGKQEYSNVLIKSTFTGFLHSFSLFVRSSAAYEALKVLIFCNCHQGLHCSPTQELSYIVLELTVPALLIR